MRTENGNQIALHVFLCRFQPLTLPCGVTLRSSSSTKTQSGSMVISTTTEFGRDCTRCFSRSCLKAESQLLVSIVKAQLQSLHICVKISQLMARTVYHGESSSNRKLKRCDYLRVLHGHEDYIHHKVKPALRRCLNALVGAETRISEERLLSVASNFIEGTI